MSTASPNHFQCTSGRSGRGRLKTRHMHIIMVMREEGSHGLGCVCLMMFVKGFFLNHVALANFSRRAYFGTLYVFRYFVYTRVLRAPGSFLMNGNDIFLFSQFGFQK